MIALVVTFLPSLATLSFGSLQQCEFILLTIPVPFFYQLYIFLAPDACRESLCCFDMQFEGHQKRTPRRQVGSKWTLSPSMATEWHESHYMLIDSLNFRHCSLIGRCYSIHHLSACSFVQQKLVIKWFQIDVPPLQIFMCPADLIDKIPYLEWSILLNKSAKIIPIGEQTCWLVLHGNRWQRYKELQTTMMQTNNPRWMSVGEKGDGDLMHCCQHLMCPKNVYIRFSVLGWQLVCDYLSRQRQSVLI